MSKVREELKYELALDVEDIVCGPPLDPENPQPFCKSYMFDSIYENHVFVRHHTDKDSYWFINSDDTSLIYKPKVV